LGRSPEVPYPQTQESTGIFLDRLVDLVNSLELAQNWPGLSFVSLTWFRDLCLLAENHGWVQDASARDEIIRNAIKDGILLTSRVPNPKAPDFRVRAIRLNRQHPQVVAVLGEQTAGAFGFEPASISGEPMSETVLRERR
jgi:hypothetical protein